MTSRLPVVMSLLILFYLVWMGRVITSIQTILETFQGFLILRMFQVYYSPFSSHKSHLVYHRLGLQIQTIQAQAQIRLRDLRVWMGCLGDLQVWMGPGITLIQTIPKTFTTLNMHHIQDIA